MEQIKIKSIWAYCDDCDRVLAETHEENPELRPIARRVVYESAQRHKDMTEHRVIVCDFDEYARRTIPN
jgi:hypothetical protein